VDCFIVTYLDSSVVVCFTITVVRLLSFLACSKGCKKQLSALPCLSTCPHGTTQLPMDGFSWWYLSLFWKLSKEYKFH